MSKSIPEPGYDSGYDPIRSTIDELEAGTAKPVSREEAKSELQERWEDFDEVAYEKQVEEARLEKERIHTETFTGKPTFGELVCCVQRALQLNACMMMLVSLILLSASRHSTA